MIANDVIASIHARLAQALAAPAGRYRPLVIDSATIGWLDAERTARLAAFPDVFEIDLAAIRLAAQLGTPAARTAALERVARALAADGLLTAWRDERYAIAPHFGAPPWCLIERAAARFFGVHTYAAHVNGLVRRDGGVAMWIARRSPEKAIDPRLLDNLVGGGIAAGAAVAATVVKEAWEEAGIDAPLAREASPVGAVHICRAQPDGLQRETIFVHDLVLPPDFAPSGQDGEVVEHRLEALAEAARLIAHSDGGDVVTADASLVIVDCLIRHGSIAPDSPDFLALDALRHAATRLE